MFDHWHPSVVRLRDAPVRVDTHLMWPSLDAGNFAPRDVRQHGLRLEAFHPGRLIAWVRQTHGGWLAVIETVADSGDGSASAPLTLWVPAGAVRRG